MDPKPPAPDLSQNRPLSPEITQNQLERPALLDPKSIKSTDHDHKEKKMSRTLETFRAKVMELALESQMSPEQKSLIEQGFQDFFPDLHVPDHPPYASMIHRAITELNEAGGSTGEAISLYIRKVQNDLPWAHDTLLTHHLDKLCEKGDVVVMGDNCYMLNNVCVAFNPNQSCKPISQFLIPSYSPNSSPSSSSSDYRSHAKRRQKKKTGRKYGKKHHIARKKAESEEEFIDSEEENFEETDEEEFEDTEEESEDTSEEYCNTEEEVEVTAEESQLIKYQKGKQTHRAEGNLAKKDEAEEKSKFRDMRVVELPNQEAEEKSEFGDTRMRVVAVPNQVNRNYNQGTKPARGRGRPPKSSGAKTYIGLKETQGEPIETHTQVAEDTKRLKQRRGRGRPSKNIEFETEIGPEERPEELQEAHDQTTGILKRPKLRRGRLPREKIGIQTDIGPKEEHKEVVKAFNQITEDLKRPREKRGRGRPPIISLIETNIGQKESQGEVIETHRQITDGLEKPKQKKGRGRLPKNSGGQIDVFEVHNKATEDGMQLKQKRIRKRYRRRYDSKEEVKHLDQLEVIVVQDMIESMVIQSRDDGENVISEVSQIFESPKYAMKDKIRKVRDQQHKSSAGGVELFIKHGLTKHHERSEELEDMENLSQTLQLPQKGTEDESYPCQLHSQAPRSETDEYATTMKEMTPSQILHEEQQPECIGEGGPPRFEPVTTLASLTVPNYQHEDGQQEQVQLGQERLLDTEETTTFMELLHSEYQHNIHDKELDQPKHQSCDVPSKPSYCNTEDDTSSR